VKKYVTAMEALIKKEKQDETEFFEFKVSTPSL
jgi:hypothetical protein